MAREEAGLEDQPTTSTAPEQPTPIIILEEHQEARSVQELAHAVQEEWQKYLETPNGRKKYANKPAPSCWRETWKRQDCTSYGHQLWLEYQLLYPDVENREAQDQAGIDKQPTTSTAPEQSTMEELPKSAAEKILDEWEKQFPKRLPEAEVPAVVKLICGNQDEASPLDYDETTPQPKTSAPAPPNSSQQSSSHVPRDTPTKDPLLNEIGQVLKTPQLATKSATSGNFRNPSPPPTPTGRLPPQEQAAAAVALADDMMRKAAHMRVKDWVVAQQVPTGPTARRTITKPEAR